MESGSSMIVIPNIMPLSARKMSGRKHEHYLHTNDLYIELITNEKLH